MANFTLKVREGIFYVHWTDAHGKRHRKSANTADKKIARQRAVDIMAGAYKAPTLVEHVAAVRAATQRPYWTFDRLFDKCRKTCWRNSRSLATLDGNIRVLSDLIGTEEVKKITYQRMMKIVDELRARGYAEATIDRKMSTLGSALTQAMKEEDGEGQPVLVAKPLMPTFQSNNFKPRVVSMDEERAIIAAIETREVKEPTRDWRRFKHLIRFLLDTGVRLGEAVSLTEDRVENHLLGGVERVSARWSPEQTKNAKDKVVWLTDAVIETLPYLRMNAIGGRLFPMSTATAWYMWSNIRKDMAALGVNVDDVVLHTLRHTCLTRMAKSGDWKIDEISRWAGHKTIQITIDRYLHLIPTDTAHLVDRLNKRNVA